MMLLSVIALLIVYSSASSPVLQPDTNSICDECKFNDGVGYLPIAGECFDFIQCQEVENGYMYAEMPCPNGTYFDPNKLTCDHCNNYTTVGNLVCDCSLNDNFIPRNYTDSDPECPNMRAVSSNATLFEVLDSTGIWVERPCAPGTVYDESICTCVHDYEDFTCSGCSLSSWGTCYKRVSCSQFIVCVGNVYYGLQTCASGLYFSLTNLVCDFPSNVNCTGPPPVPPPTCRPEVYLPFTDDASDQSGKNIYVLNEGVVANGYGIFDTNTYIQMNRFSNADFRSTLKIEFQVGLGYDFIANQTILSNADCGIEGSIYIIQESSTNMKFRVFNDAGDEYTLDVDISSVMNVLDTSYVRPVSWVTLMIANGVMTASVDGVTESIDFYGNICRRHCALHLGLAEGYNDFTGDLDEFKLYMCI